MKILVIAREVYVMILHKIITIRGLWYTKLLEIYKKNFKKAYSNPRASESVFNDRIAISNQLLLYVLEIKQSVWAIAV